MLTLDEAKQKIAKLARLRDNHAATPEEAATAALRISEIMEKYQIDEASLGFQSEEDEKQSGFTFDNSTNKNSTWRFQIAFRVGQNNSCYIWVDHKNRILAIGRPIDFNASKYVYDLICNQIMEITKEALSQQWDITESGESRRWCHAFRMGCASSISERLLQIRENRKAGSMALMVLDKRLFRAANLVNILFDFKAEVPKQHLKANNDIYDFLSLYI